MRNHINYVTQRSLASTLSRKIIHRTFLIFFFAMVTIATVAGISNKRAATKNAESALDSTIKDIEKILTAVESSTEAMAWIISDEKSEYDPMDITTQMVRSDTSIVSCAVAYENGLMVTDKATTTDGSFRPEEWYRIPKALKKSYWSEPWLDITNDGESRTMITSYSVPLLDSLGTFKGIIKSDVELKWLTQKISDLKPFKDSYTILLAKDGTYLAHPTTEYIYNEDIFSVALQRKNDQMTELGMKVTNGESGIMKFNNAGTKVFAIYSPLRNGWSALMLCPVSEFHKDSRIIFIMLLIISVLGIIALYYSTDISISKALLPVTEFTYAASIMAKGKFDVKVPEVNTKDEIRGLRDSLAYLQASITTYIRELRQTLTANEKYESELNIASNIQESMLPKVFIKRDNVDIYATLSPAKEVGGDLYDFYVKDGRLFFAIGDVSGKGVPAALFMAITRAAHRFISSLGMTTDEVAFNINNSFADSNETGMFVTMFVGNIDLKTLKMEYCNSGHNPIIIISPDGGARYLHAKANIAAGLFEDFTYEGESLQLEKGSRILLYTDGISEAETRDKELYGEDRLLAYANNAPKSMDSKEFTDGLIADVRKFTNGNDQNDDITVMTITL